VFWLFDSSKGLGIVEAPAVEIRGWGLRNHLVGATQVSALDDRAQVCVLDRGGALGFISARVSTLRPIVLRPRLPTSDPRTWT